MEIKAAEFDSPITNRTSSGIHEKMFNQDVGFRFLVDVKYTDRKDLESMMKLFDKMAADFKKDWQAKIDELH
jgi:hypothetical protein